eukprot:TRINITY_DN18855_c0_g1_i2.p1 TRINITY_DN18855_c0_g1~~TRINITY_DN18855_c0_g1_i2.p1  ORF type:complete len:66 (-),score=17.20 TRINITY_DN18855_c0_g1_i2:160-357(-)
MKNHPFLKDIKIVTEKEYENVTYRRGRGQPKIVFYNAEDMVVESLYLEDTSADEFRALLDQRDLD